jgi:hypothetical protein
MYIYYIVAALLYLVPSLAAAQARAAKAAPTRAGHRSLLPREVEITLARSAAPASVSKDARVLIFADTAFIVAENGTNGVTCIVNRSWPASLEPHCFDAEASETILPMEMRRTILYHQGHSEAEVDREIAGNLAKGVFHLPRRPAMSYMMSDGQQLIGDSGNSAGHWRPHIMIYYPFLKNSDLGFSKAPDIKIGMVADEASASSSIMIIMPQFVPVAPVKR